MLSRLIMLIAGSSPGPYMALNESEKDSLAALDRVRTLCTYDRSYNFDVCSPQFGD